MDDPNGLRVWVVINYMAPELREAGVIASVNGHEIFATWNGGIVSFDYSGTRLIANYQPECMTNNKASYVYGSNSKALAALGAFSKGIAMVNGQITKGGEMSCTKTKDALRVLVIRQENGKDLEIAFSADVLATDRQKAVLLALSKDGAPSLDDVTHCRIVFVPQGSVSGFYSELKGGDPHPATVTVIRQKDGKDVDYALRPKNVIAPQGMELYVALRGENLDPSDVAENCRVIVECIGGC